MSDTRLYTSSRLFKRLFAPCFSHLVERIKTKVEALRPKISRCITLNQKCPNAILYCAVHPLGTSIILKHVRSGFETLSTTPVKIHRAHDELSSAIQHNLLYHVSRLLLDTIDYTLQQLSFFTLLLHV